MKKDAYREYLRERLPSVSIDTSSSGIPSVRVVEYGSVLYWISDVPITHDTTLFTSVELDHAVMKCLEHRVVYELTVHAESPLCVCIGRCGNTSGRCFHKDHTRVQSGLHGDPAAVRH